MFTKYSVITKLQNKYRSSFNTKDFYIVSVQHILESTGSMFEAFINLGFKPQNIYLTGKLYSTNEEIQSNLKALGLNVFESTIPTELGNYADSLALDICLMWQKLSEQIAHQSKIIVLDDGGYASKNIPNNILKNHKVFGIEQTTSGAKMIKEFEKFPIIDVAESAAKVIIEPPIISESIKNLLGDTIEKLCPKKIGIVGFGHIGKALAIEFKSKYQILVYDNNNDKLSKDDYVEGVIYCYSMIEIYNQSDIIIGATGEDISNDNWVTNSVGNKTLISVSSGDVEFRGLLKQSNQYLMGKIESPLQELNYKTKQKHNIKILRGGMVSNFTGAKHSCPGEFIQMTRGLLFSAVIQILRDSEFMCKENNPIMLDPKLQKEVIDLWFADQPQKKIEYSKEVLFGFNDLDWIKSKSRGNILS